MLEMTGNLAHMKSTSNTTENPAPLRPADSVERIYEALKERAVNYEFRPGQKVKEVELAAQLSVSRTPIREALNRLVVDELMTFEPNKGFFCRDIDAQEVFDLYELRATLELGAFSRIEHVASYEDIDALCANWNAIATRRDSMSAADLAQADEHFHEALAGMAGNAVLLKTLRNVNARIRFFRAIEIDSAEHRERTFAEHAQLVELLRTSDFKAAYDVLASHLSMSTVHALDVTKRGLARAHLEVRTDQTGP